MEQKSSKPKRSMAPEVIVRTMKDILDAEKAQKQKYVPPQKRTEGKDVIVRDPIRIPSSSSTSSSSSSENAVQYDKPAAEKSEVDKGATSEKTPSAVVKRPFDEVHPVPRPMLPRNGAIAISEVAGRPREVDPNTDTHKLKKGPHTRVEPSSAKRSSEEDDFQASEEEVADLILGNNTMLPTGKLLKVSPGVRRIIMQRLRNMGTRRTPLKSFLTEIWAETVDIIRPEERAEDVNSFLLHVDDIPSGDVYEVLKVETNGLPVGAVVHKDIVETYKQELPPAERNKVIIVASPSDALKSVYPVVNKSGQEVESILDGGSQIVAMDLAVAVGVGLTWDPDTTIHMQSANGSLKRTKGLARNVPFNFGDLTIYLQIHVIDNAPYKVLLGRPFDVLTESTIQNYADGYQDLTLKCPNSGHRVTVGTYSRGEGKRIPERHDEPKLRSMERPPLPPPSDSEDMVESEPKEALANSEPLVNFQWTLMN